MLTDNKNTILLRDDIILINEFLTDEITQKALLLEESIWSESDKNYAGKSAPLPKELSELIMDRFISLGFNFSKLQHGRIRVATEHDINDFNSLVHTDHICKRVLVIYVLNTLFIHPREAGTLFWEHKSTKKKLLNLSNPRDIFLHSLILDKESKDLSRWNEWLNCPFIQNSALVFNSLYFHSPPSPLFKKNSVGKRITLDLFLD